MVNRPESGVNRCYVISRSILGRDLRTDARGNPMRGWLRLVAPMTADSGAAHLVDTDGAAHGARWRRVAADTLAVLGFDDFSRVELRLSLGGGRATGNAVATSDADLERDSTGRMVEFRRRWAFEAPLVDCDSVPVPSRDIGEHAWTVSEMGYGPVRANMTVAEARKVLYPSLESPREPQCDHIGWLGRTPGVPPSALLMVVNGQVARVEVNDTSIITSMGARVGDSEERVRTLYPGRVRVEPHKYTDGHYLIIPRGTGADSVLRLVFETENGRVTRFRAGRYPEVQWVEGCS